jgi:hypothetical protein
MRAWRDRPARMRDVDATLAQWQEILDVAMRFAQNCGTAYRVANERTRTLYNRAVFETLIVRDGCIAEPHYAAPFGLVFATTEFGQGSLERETGLEPATSTLGRLHSTVELLPRRAPALAESVSPSPLPCGSALHSQERALWARCHRKARQRRERGCPADLALLRRLPERFGMAARLTLDRCDRLLYASAVLSPAD